MRHTPGNTMAETQSIGVEPVATERRTGSLIEKLQGGAVAERPRDAWISAVLDGEAPEAVPLVPLRPGDAIPGTRYVIERWLGDGGMGVVYEARHVDIERHVAIKVLRQEFCRKPLVMSQFRNEARIVGRIGSRHIAEVFDFAELPDGRLLFVMELLRGQTVAKALRAGPMAPERVIAIMRQVCKALAAAHAIDVVHRDLKPDNIVLCTAEGREDFVKLLDFGVAIVMSDAGVATHLAAGTPWYLAPEVIAGAPIDARVDIYAAGCTAYEMLTGRPPFDMKDLDGVLRAHLEQPPMAPHERVPEIPAALSRVVMRCLQKPRAARYGTMVELEAALCEAQIEARLRTSWDDLELPEVEPARRAALLQRMPDPRRPARRRRRWVVAGLGLVAGTGVLVGWLASQPADLSARAPIDALVVEAHEAAAQSYFVYPPPDEPARMTAFRAVIQLEARADELGDDASAEAARLRDEFASTLVRLGDEYWARDGGRPFAIDYYAEALMFQPELEQAQRRVAMTPGQLAALRDKAERTDFTEAELIAAEPLIALAESDPTRRDEKLTALQQRSRRAATTDESLARLSRSSAAVAKRSSAAARPTESAPTAAAPAAPPDVLAVAPPAPAADPAAGDAGTESDESTREPSARDPEAAAELVAEGEQARKQGARAAAARAFERALALDPRAHAAIMGLSDLAFDAGDYTRAATLARRAVKLAPRNGGYRVRLGDAYFKAFRYEQAMTEYREAESLGHAAAAGRIAKVADKLR
ncbi:MAG: serine/threonine protein kinase [Nannocystaceae bacterium]|nr:serine/threonine protein kinase [Nannocystaceae bacterium]